MFIIWGWGLVVNNRREVMVIGVMVVGVMVVVCSRGTNGTGLNRGINNKGYWTKIAITIMNKKEQKSTSISNKKDSTNCSNFIK